jgi:hypothetical protein
MPWYTKANVIKALQIRHTADGAPFTVESRQIYNIKLRRKIPVILDGEYAHYKYQWYAVCHDTSGDYIPLDTPLGPRNFTIAGPRMPKERKLLEE